MTPTVMESGTIAEIDGWPCAMNMPKSLREAPWLVVNFRKFISQSRRSKGACATTLFFREKKKGSHESRRRPSLMCTFDVGSNCASAVVQF